MKLVVEKRHIEKAMAEWKPGTQCNSCCPVYQAYAEQTGKSAAYVMPRVIFPNSDYDRKVLNPPLPVELALPRFWSEALANAPYVFEVED